MLDAFRVTWQGFRDLWEQIVLLVMLNLVWSLAVLLALAPLLFWGGANLILALGLSLLLALPLPILSGALCFVTNQVARGNAVGWGTFGNGLRRYWAKSLVVALINLVALVLIVANLQFYAFVLQGTWTNVVLSIWLVVGLYWLIAQIYWFPMILELERERVLLALRNALAMVIITPGFSLTLGAILLVLTVLGIILTVPLPLFLAALLLLIMNHATRSRLALIRSQHKSRETDLNKEL